TKVIFITKLFKGNVRYQFFQDTARERGAKIQDRIAFMMPAPRKKNGTLRIIRSKFDRGDPIKERHSEKAVVDLLEAFFHLATSRLGFQKFERDLVIEGRRRFSEPSLNIDRKSTRLNSS